MKTDKAQAIVDGQGMMQMYQAGFLDGYRARRSYGMGKYDDAKLWSKVKFICMAAFEKRFNKKEAKKGFSREKTDALNKEMDEIKYSIKRTGGI